MKFGELKEGKIYTTGTHLFTIKSGGLFFIDYERYSSSRMNEIMDMIFTEVKQLTENERLLYSLLSKEYQWVATDETCEVYAFEEKPIRNNFSFSRSKGKFINIPSNHINLTWGDEPLYIGYIERR